MQSSVAPRAIARTAAGALPARLFQQVGLICYSNGQITVTDRAGLQSAGCECDGVVASEFERLLGPPGVHVRRHETELTHVTSVSASGLFFTALKENRPTLAMVPAPHDIN